MIDKIYIKDFAIIRELDLPLMNGFTVITGETGAGKSLIVKALSIALGSKVDKTDVRSNQERAVVEVADSSNALYRRVISKAGRAKSFINEEPHDESTFRSSVSLLADFHGQNDQQLIMNPQTHIDFLDRFCKNEFLVEQTSDLYQKILTLEQKLNEKKSLQDVSNDKKELLEFQLKEIDEIDPQVDEDSSLTSEFKRLNNIEETISAIQKLNQNLTEHDHSIYRQLYSASDELEKLSKLDSRLTPLYETLEQASLSIQDASSALVDHLNTLDADPEKLSEIHDRLQSVESLKRKYGGSIEAVIDNVSKIRAELEELNNLDSVISSLEIELDSLRNEYSKLAEKLSSTRKDKSNLLAKKIVDTMSTLNMNGATFKVEIVQNVSSASPIIYNGDPVKYGPKGFDSVEFYLSANPGESIKPLSKIASGGEVSRIMLSIKSVFKDQDPVSTLIFDEIDAGISGEAAEKVAKALKNLSSDKQVICITHLPQIASLADHHLFVGKKVVDGNTHVSASYLNDKEKIEAVAKLFSGENDIQYYKEPQENYNPEAHG